MIIWPECACTNPVSMLNSLFGTIYLEMIRSMTGFGKSEATLETGKLTIEIRTLNGKNADVSIKTSMLPKDKELIVRQQLADSLQRGTIDFFVNFEAKAADSAKKINSELVQEYYRQVSEVRTMLGDKAETGVDINILSTILKFQDIIDTKKQDIITEENWNTVQDAIDKAIDNVNNYRETEGAALYKDVVSRVNNILNLENEVEGFEPERIEAVRSKIAKSLEDLQQKPDQSRFEQEMIFYLEKLDINEEKVRLRQHCKFFLETIDKEAAPGRKLGFIIQEMGREINTTGSKANHAGIQKTVVRMKDELEKIREQSMNIL